MKRASDAQDRPQRCPRPGASRPHRLLQTRSCESLPAHAVRSLIIARKKLVGQRVTLENQIRGLAVVFGIRLPRALSPAFIRQALGASEGIAGLSAAMQGLVAARVAVLAAVTAIDADIKRSVPAKV
jgi:transposase